LVGQVYRGNRRGEKRGPPDTGVKNRKTKWFWWDKVRWTLGKGEGNCRKADPGIFQKRNGRAGTNGCKGT